jgi:hypothetical protein
LHKTKLHEQNEQVNQIKTKITLRFNLAVQVLLSRARFQTGRQTQASKDGTQFHAPNENKISDRAGERAWPQVGRTNYSKLTHQSGARFAASLG